MAPPKKKIVVPTYDYDAVSAYTGRIVDMLNECMQKFGTHAALDVIANVAASVCMATNTPTDEFKSALDALIEHAKKVES
jgi:predicted FMN-binding regulatory protein PaiB